MFDVHVGLRLLCISAGLTIVQVKQTTAVKHVCGSFERRKMHDGIVPTSGHFIMKSLTGLDKEQCFKTCHLERSCCVGLLYNKVEMKCNLLKRDLTVVDKDATASNEEWEYFRITGACGDSWLPYCGHCYLFNVVNLAWQAADEHCKSLGSHLVDVRSQDEDNWIKNITAASPIIWSGGNDMENEGQYVWSSDKSAFVYTKWQSGQPNNYDNQDCIEMYQDGWNDESCSRQLPSVCKKSIYM